MDLLHVLLQIVQRLVHLCRVGELQLRAAHELHLVDVVDVNPELCHPEGRVGHGRVDRKRATAHVHVGEALQTVEGGDAKDGRLQPGVDLLVGKLAEDLVEGDAGLVQGAGVGQHADHGRIPGIQVGVEDERLGAELRGHAREAGPRPDAVVEHDAVHARGSASSCHT